MFTIGNDELLKSKYMKDGDTITCPRCGKTHQVTEGKDEDGLPGGIFFYSCGNKHFLAGIGGRNIMSRFAKPKEEQL